VLDTIAEYWNMFVDFLYSCILSLGEILKDTLMWCIDGLMVMAIAAVDGIGSLFGSLNVVQYVDAIPPETKNILALIGINEASSMIVSAIIIRLILQLIPFVRFGS